MARSRVPAQAPTRTGGSSKPRTGPGPRPSPGTFDTVVVGGGPAGAVAAWALAKWGARVAVLDRARFPRPKVCGDFVEPRGIRLFERMGGGQEWESLSSLPITHVSLFLRSTCAYRGSIPFYGHRSELPGHGMIVPRETLDSLLLDCARRAGAVIYEGCPVTGITRNGGQVEISAQENGRRATFRGRLVVGADGVRSVVARSVGLTSDDPRYIAVSQRAYVEGVSLDRGEASFFFDDDLSPGYGWMFPIGGGRANVGVGILSEARRRCRRSVPQLFQAFTAKLKDQHPGCGRIRIVGRPAGGMVNTYGGARENFFHGGVLVGDAGCFVDPMTGEGITPAAESALIAASVLRDALDEGRFDASFLSRYQEDFRRYFDPSMRYLVLCQSVMRNRHLRDFWFRVIRRGCEMAEEDSQLARVAGSTFGGMEVKPFSILAQVWWKVAEDLLKGGFRAFQESLKGRADLPGTWFLSLGEMNLGMWRSFLDDPLWHTAWSVDVMDKWVGLMGTLGLPADPRKWGPELPGAGDLPPA